MSLHSLWEYWTKFQNSLTHLFQWSNDDNHQTGDKRWIFNQMSLTFLLHVYKGCKSHLHTDSVKQCNANNWLLFTLWVKLLSLVTHYQYRKRKYNLIMFSCVLFLMFIKNVVQLSYIEINVFRYIFNTHNYIIIH